MLYRLGQYLVLVIAIFGSAASRANELVVADLPCEDYEHYEFACGLVNPEDLVYFKPTGEILFGQLADKDLGVDNPIGVLDPDTMVSRQLGVRINQAESWGQSGCQAPNRFDTHGIDLSQRADGRWQLLVVNHYQRESIEIYEVVNDAGKATLIGRGCVKGEKGSAWNDIVALPEGGFMVTQPMPHPDTFMGKVAMLKLWLGMNTGWVVRWSQSDGFEIIDNLRASYPNGIQLSPDGRRVFLNAYGSSEVLVFDRQQKSVITRIDVPHPDNSNWAPTGLLLVAAHQPDSLLSLTPCLDAPVGINCVVPFSIVAINPKTQEPETIFTHSDSRLAGATAAIELNGDLFFGSFASDRIVKVKNYRQIVSFAK